MLLSLLLNPTGLSLAILLTVPFVASFYKLYEYKKQLENVFKRPVTIQETMSIIYEYGLTRFNMKLYGTSREANGTEYVYYYHNSSAYKFPVITKRGPKVDIESVTTWDEDDNTREITEDESTRDVTSDILMYAGPNRDFYGLLVTPKILGYNDLTFKINGEERKVERDENIYQHIQ